MGFSRQKYWSGLPFHTPENLCYSVIEPGFPALLADSLPSELPGKRLSMERVLKNQTTCFREKITFFFIFYIASHYHHHSILEGHFWHFEYSVHFSKADNSSKKTMLHFLFLMTVLRCERASAWGDEVMHSKRSEEKVWVLFSTSFIKLFSYFWKIEVARLWVLRSVL